MSKSRIMVGRYSLREFAHKLDPAYHFPDLVGALSDAFPKVRYLLRAEAVPFLVGDYATAMLVSRRRARRRDSQSLFISLASEWSFDAEAALSRAEELRWEGGSSVLAALTRFYLYLEMPERAQEMLDAILDPEPNLMVRVASSWQRHGEPAKAVEVLERTLDGDPRSPSARDALEEVKGEQAVVEWSWVPEVTGGSSATGFTRGGGETGSGYSPAGRRVLHMVARSLPHHHAGSTYRTHYTLTAQREAGLDAHIVTECGFPAEFVTSNGSLPTEIHEEIEYLRLPEQFSHPRLDRRFQHHFEKASDVVADLRPAVLHPHSDFRNAAVALALRERFGTPVLYEVRGFPEEYLPRRPASRMLYERFGMRRKIEAECWRRADKVVTLAEVMKEHIVSKGVDPAKVEVIPNAVDAERFRPPEVRDEALAARLGIESGESVIGYVSSLTAPYEGIRYLIEAVVHLTRQGRRVRALIVGEGAERPHLMEVAERLGVRDRVIFTGQIGHDRLPAHYSLIDVFVVPRTSEATTELVTPLKPLEAMAMERAVLVSGTRALREMIVEGETGLSFEPDNVADLVAKVESLIDQPERMHELGQTARQWVIENRSWTGNAERYREIYAELGVEVS